MGPISNIGPKTSRAARDRPEHNLEEKIHPSQQSAGDHRRTAAAAGNTLRGCRANKRKSSRAQRPSIAQHLARGRARNSAIKCAIGARIVGHHRATNCTTSSSQRPISKREAAPSIRPPCATSSREARQVCCYRACTCARGGAPPRKAAPWPRSKILIFDLKIEIRYNMATIVMKDPSHSSDITVGEPWRIRIPSPGEAAEE
ncbi:FRIGIDA-like protein 1 [Dorcoceras hygrometricum]|uniref:FRIGIDA-like protein 1 n=1 Tax=Dorcoceras hygrometricum TaxID=472368 RepID=A0A2Z7ART6_9LAMI|nr:FRIGIDA-like protein 1 [Dorcoceras hygrometricum]